MKRLMAWAVLMVGLGVPMFASGHPAQSTQPVQAAQPAPSAQPSEQTRVYVPKLGDIMAITQLRHYKLWYAAKVKNWALANYELDQMKNSFLETLQFYPGLPEADMRIMEKPASEIRSAIAAQDPKTFVSAYLKLSNACNECHKSYGYPFIVIKTPGASLASPFSDQSFEK